MTQPFEIANNLTNNFQGHLIRKGMKNTKILLTKKGLEYIKKIMGWDYKQNIGLLYDKLIDSIKNKISRINDLDLMKKDFRINEVIKKFERIHLIDKKYIRFGNKRINLFKNYDIISSLIDLLLLITKKIHLKEIIFLKDLMNDIQTLIPQTREYLKSILNYNLILYNIFPEPLRIEKRDEIIYFELQSFILNILEPELKNFIFTKLIENEQIEKIWFNRIPKNVRKSIKFNYISNQSKINRLSKNLIELNYEKIVNNHMIMELLSYSYFGAISKIIGKQTNWDDIFQKYFSNFKNSNEFTERFKDVNLLRIMIAHKKSKNSDIIKLLKSYGLNLSDILGKIYDYYYPIKTSKNLP